MLSEGTRALLHFYIPFTLEFVTHYTMKRLCRALQYDSDENTDRTKLIISRYLQTPMIHGRSRERIGLIRSSIGMTLWSKSCKQHTKAALAGLTSTPNPCKKGIPAPACSTLRLTYIPPEKGNNQLYCGPQLVMAEVDHLKDTRTFLNKLVQRERTCSALSHSQTLFELHETRYTVGEDKW